jgi:hypothetical protein
MLITRNLFRLNVLKLRKVAHVGRESQKRAHTLAKYAQAFFSSGSYNTKYIYIYGGTRK